MGIRLTAIIFKAGKPGPFGLFLNQQLGGNHVLYETTWCNHLGQFLGQGDISGEQLGHISKEIDPNDAFVVFAREPYQSYLNSAKDTAALVERALIIVVRNKLYSVNDDAPGATRLMFDQTFTFTTADAMIQLLEELDD